MIRWCKKIKQLFDLSSRIAIMESEIKELDNKIKKSVLAYSQEFELNIKKTFKEKETEFENKIQQMSFAYTANLDDAKADYLKKYLECRLDNMGHQLRILPETLRAMQSDIRRISIEVLETDKKE